MTRDELNNQYFDWMYQLVCKDSKGLSYRKLLYCLHSTPFTYTIAMDGNRAEDGTNLRYRFGYEHGYDDRLIAEYLDDKPCSVLEMMVALAVRCEEHIMSNPDIGDRTGQWFWTMVVSLGLSGMQDYRFDRDRADHILENFLNRTYQSNGEGGLFTVDNSRRDMRYVEIWYQMCWYLEGVS